MTYQMSGGDLMMVGPRVQSHRLQPNEALSLLDAHRQDYRRAFTAGDKESAQHALRLVREILLAGNRPATAMDEMQMSRG